MRVIRLDFIQFDINNLLKAGETTFAILNAYQYRISPTRSSTLAGIARMVDLETGGRGDKLKPCCITAVLGMSEPERVSRFEQDPEQ